MCTDFFQGRSLGAIYGLALIAGGSGGALGPLFSAYIFDATGSYTPGLPGCPGCPQPLQCPDVGRCPQEGADGGGEGQSSGPGGPWRDC
ncbi:MAG: hypothetical protein HYY20_11810 [Candidatus Tectomicrobia bacterium]|uniref:Major facilitator superfamily (MFS) profile domain-containing protein n=1 Tax=Tectimicrobiota bacterium TaxID=2528274 RepID=A0A932CQB9_UNCTE|nr:hypothetical protein [Candidatus Tectomicrobia bacterium]